MSYLTYQPDACDRADFCLELEEPESRDTPFWQVYGGNPPSRLVHADEHTCAIVDLAPLHVGHLLVVPRKHVLSMGHLDEGSFRHVSKVAQEMCLRLKDAYEAQITILEHGSSTSQASGACISHAHWHLIPSPTKMLDFFRRDGVEGIEHDDPYRILADLAAADRPYLLHCVDDERTTWVSEAPQIPSQYVRRIGAEAVGNTVWDWALNTDLGPLRATFERLTN